MVTSRFLLEVNDMIIICLAVLNKFQTRRLSCAYVKNVRVYYRKVILLCESGVQITSSVPGVYRRLTTKKVRTVDTMTSLTYLSRSNKMIRWLCVECGGLLRSGMAIRKRPEGNYHIACWFRLQEEKKNETLLR